MSFYQQNIDFAIGRHTDMVRIGERRALRIAEDEPRARIGEGLYRSVASWLGKQWARWAHDLLHPRATPAHGEQSAG
jgi:hypothetical protein